MVDQGHQPNSIGAFFGAPYEDFFEFQGGMTILCFFSRTFW